MREGLAGWDGVLELAGGDADADGDAMPRMKALVLELLAAVCLVRGGHEIILAAFDNFKEVRGEWEQQVQAGMGGNGERQDQAGIGLDQGETGTASDGGNGAPESGWYWGAGPWRWRSWGPQDQSGMRGTPREGWDWGHHGPQDQAGMGSLEGRGWRDQGR